MTQIIVTLLGGVGSIMKYTFWTAVGVTGLAAGVAFLTKPGEHTFRAGLLLEDKTYHNSTFDQATKWAASKVIEQTTEVEFQDYVVLRVANVKLAGQPQAKFVGAFQNWYQVPESTNNE